jgi:hypothetical protein
MVVATVTIADRGLLTGAPPVYHRPAARESAFFRADDDHRRAHGIKMFNWIFTMIGSSLLDTQCLRSGSFLS